MITFALPEGEPPSIEQLMLWNLYRIAQVAATRGISESRLVDAIHTAYLEHVSRAEGSGRTALTTDTRAQVDPYVPDPRALAALQRWVTKNRQQQQDSPAGSPAGSEGSDRG